MIKLKRIDAIMVVAAMIFILPQLHIAPESASPLYSGVYGVTDSIIKGLVSLIIFQLLSRKS